MPWPGSGSAPTPPPTRSSGLAVPNSGFNDYARRERQIREGIAAQQEAEAARRERENRRCPPVPPPSGLRTPHIAARHTMNEFELAMDLLSSGYWTMYSVDMSKNIAMAAHQSTTAHNGEYGWQVWSWAGTGWALNSTYMRSNLGEPFRSSKSAQPPPRGCRPITLR